MLYGIKNLKNVDLINLRNYIPIQNNWNWIVKSILYASYNSVLLIPVLISIKELIIDNKSIKNVSVGVSGILIILIIIVFLLLINVDVDIKQLQMPAVYAVNNIWPEIKKIYGIIILISIFTTAISLGISFLKNVTNNEKNYNSMSILICTSAVIFSRIGFSNLINFMYPFLGILGLLQMILIIRKQ